jgi:hypothetical protein
MVVHSGLPNTSPRRIRGASTITSGFNAGSEGRWLLRSCRAGRPLAACRPAAAQRRARRARRRARTPSGGPCGPQGWMSTAGMLRQWRSQPSRTSTWKSMPQTRSPSCASSRIWPRGRRSLGAGLGIGLGADPAWCRRDSARLVQARPEVRACAAHARPQPPACLPG